MNAISMAYEWLSRRARQPQSNTEIAKARLALRRECNSWIKSANITGFGIGEKLVDGVRTGLPALQVFVARKLTPSHLSANVVPAVLRLPHSHELVLLDVVQMGAGRPHEEMRRIGDGIRRSNAQAAIGTVGCFTRPSNPASAARYALTCWHVAANGSASGAVVDWCDDAQGLPPNIRLGTLDRSIRPDMPDSSGIVRDVALVRLDDGFDLVNRNRAGIAISGLRTTAVSTGETVHVYGFGSKSIRLGVVTNPRASKTLFYPGLGTVAFQDAILCTSSSQPGDSGSVAVDDSGNAVGIVVGGEIPSGGDQGWTLLVPLPPVMNHFALRLLPEATKAQAMSSLGGRTMLPVSSDMASAIDTLARTIWGEAEGEPTIGKIAVANVIVNRVRAGKPARFGGTVETVCTKNNGSTWQFSCWTDGSNRAAKSRAATTQNAAFRECLDIARRAVSGQLDDMTSGSDHYHAISVHPNWSSGRTPILVVGRHMFFNSIP